MANIIIPDGGTIGSTSDTDALTISSSGAVTFSQDINPNNFVGMIAPFGMSSVPTGWLACDGSAVSRTTYADLFTAIGTTWGAGDGSSTFALPDLEGAFLRGTGTHNTENMQDGSTKYAGPSVGSFESDQIASHRHAVRFQSFPAGNPGSKSGHGYTEVALDRSSYGADTNYTGGDETRPFNAGVKYCIKY